MVENSVVTSVVNLREIGLDVFLINLQVIDADVETIADDILIEEHILVHRVFTFFGKQWKDNADIVEIFKEIFLIFHLAKRVIVARNVYENLLKLFGAKAELFFQKFL